MTEFDEIRNRIERETEKKYPGSGNTPGYRGPRYGEWTPGAPGHDVVSEPLPPLRIPLVQYDRTFRYQLVLADAEGERVFWVDTPRARAENSIESAVLPGDIVLIAEVPHSLYVRQVCVGIPEKDICVPHRTGTLMAHYEIVPRRKGNGEQEPE